MTISVPTSIALDNIITDVTEPEIKVFVNDGNADNYIWTYPPEFEYQYDGKIYQNTSLESVPVAMWDVADIYAINDMVFKDNFIQKLISKTGTIPVQPWDYPAHDDGFDHTTWAERYTLAYPQVDGYTNGDAFSGAGDNMTDLKFSKDGTKVYWIDDTLNAIYQYTLTEPWVLGSRSYDGSEEMASTTCAFCFSDDGTLVYLMRTSGYITQHFLSIPWDLTGSVLNFITSVTQEIVGVYTGICISSDGRHVYTTRDNKYVQQYYLGIVWLISTLSYINMTNSLCDPDTSTGVAKSPYISPDGLKFYVYDTGYHRFYAHDLNTPNQLDAFTTIKSYYYYYGALGFTFKYDGTRAFSYNTLGANTVYEHAVPVAWDITVAYHNYKPTSWSVTRFSDNGNNRHEYGVGDLGFGLYIFTSDLYVGATHYQEASVVAVYSALTNDSLDTEAYIYGDGTNESWVGKVMIIGTDGCWFRTHISSLQLTTDVDEDIFEITATPADITNFAYIKATNDMSPFDGKNYSIATKSNSMSYIIVGTEAFDTVALGNVKAEHVNIAFISLDGTAITPIDIDLNVYRDTHEHLKPWHTTAIYYSTDAAIEEPTSTYVLPAGSSITLTLTSPTFDCDVELATLMLGMSAGAGFTNLQLKNTYKDFSTFQYDTFGNVDYVDKAKVSRYSGSVDMRIENYDMTDRLMTSLGQNLVMVNGSDGLNNPTNSRTIFAATQKIGRFVAFDQRTVVKDADMDIMATYTFTLEEIV